MKITAIVLTIFIITVLFFAEKADRVRNAKYDTCFASLTEQDPNETEARSKELSECMDNTNVTETDEQYENKQMCEGYALRLKREDLPVVCEQFYPN